MDFPRQTPYSGPLPDDFPLVGWGGERLKTWEDYYRVRDRLLDDPDTPLAKFAAASVEEKYDDFTHDR